MIEASGSGSVTLTSGSGSRRPKNIWIRNTGEYAHYINRSASISQPSETRLLLNADPELIQLISEQQRFKEGKYYKFQIYF
jgi:hypothetical protein